MKKSKYLDSKEDLFIRARILKVKLHELEYEHYLESANSDINALYHTGFVKFTDSMKFFDFLKDVELLLDIIIEKGNELKN